MDPNKLKQFREAAIKAGYKSADVDKFLTKKQEEMATVNLVKQGQIPFETLAQSSPVLASKLLQQGFTPQPNPDVGSKEEGQLFEEGLISDTRSGKFSVPELFKRYGGMVDDPNRILEIYNQNSQYGPATESSEQLAQFGVNTEKFITNENKPTKLSASERITAERYKTALDLTNEFEGSADNFKKTNAVSGRATKIFQNYIPQLADPDLITLDSRIGPIRESVVNAISGAQVSQQEAERVMSWIPDISKSPQKNREDLISLKGWLKTHYANITNIEPKSSKSERPPLTNFLIQ